MSQQLSMRTQSKLLDAARTALRDILICQDDIAMNGSGGGSESDAMCEEAKFLNPCIKALRKAIQLAEKDLSK